MTLSNRLRKAGRILSLAVTTVSFFAMMSEGPFWVNAMFIALFAISAKAYEKLGGLRKNAKS